MSKQLLGFVALTALLPISAFACPNLSGNFVCKDFDTGAEQHVTITPNKVGGANAFQVKVVAGGETSVRDYVVDGVTRAADRPDYVNRTERSYCAGNQLKVEVKGKRKDNGDLLNAIVTINLDAKGNLYDSYIGTEGSKQLNFEETCLRK